MKKYIIMGLLLFTPFVSKASLMGFQDGNMYDPATSTWQCLFLMDGNCYDLNQNILFTRPPGYVPPVIVPDTVPTQTVYVPVYSTPNNQPIGGVPQSINQPIITNSTTQGVSMLPAYSESELLNKFYTVYKQDGGKMTGPDSRMWPVNVVMNPGEPVIFNWQGDSNNYSKCTITFNDSVILDGSTGIQHADISDLQLFTKYSYTLTYHEDGREDTVLTKSFTTPAQ